MTAQESIENLSADVFEPHLGTRFRLYDGDGNSTEISLVEVKRLQGRPTQRRKPFSLLFRGSSDVRVAQGLYLFEHGVLAPLQLFLVPVAPDAQGPCYEAVFN